MQEFPKWLFSLTGGPPVLVHTAAEQARLGTDYAETPNGEPEPVGAGVNQPPTETPAATVYVPQEYPKFLFRRQQDGAIASVKVQDASAEAALGKDWSEEPPPASPVAASTGEPEPVATTEPASSPRAKGKKAADAVTV